MSKIVFSCSFIYSAVHLEFTRCNYTIIRSGFHRPGVFNSVIIAAVRTAREEKIVAESWVITNGVDDSVRLAWTSRSAFLPTTVFCTKQFLYMYSHIVNTYIRGPRCRPLIFELNGNRSLGCSDRLVNNAFKAPCFVREASGIHER